LNEASNKEETAMPETDPKDPKPKREAPVETPEKDEPIDIELPMEPGDANGQPV
jgi:hypothetical protein